MNRSWYKLLYVAGSVVALAFTATAQAALLTLVNPAPADQQYQQTLNSPCIFGDPSCNNPAGFGSVTFPAGGTGRTYTETSLSYTVGQIRAIVGNTFFIGIDVNTTTSPLATEQLDFFDVFIGGVQQYVFDPASPGTSFVTTNNGNGFADALLQSVDLAAFGDDVAVLFHVVQNNSTDGREQYFLISTTNEPPLPPFAQIPEPASLALVGLGLLGLAGLRRKKA